MITTTGVGALSIVGLAIIGITFVIVSLQSRDRLPFTVSKALYIGVWLGAVILVAQSLVDSMWESTAITFIGSFSWAIGYEIGLIGGER